jgi:hypothetical protein
LDSTRRLGRWLDGSPPLAADNGRYFRYRLEWIAKIDVRPISCCCFLHAAAGSDAASTAVN